MRKTAILALLLTLALPAGAAEEKAGESPSKGGKPGTNVDMPFLMAPILDAGGKLTGYAYISSRLTATSESFALVVRDKLPFIQDAFVRDVNGAAVAVPDDPQKVDIAGVEARLLADARRVIGAAKVKVVTICTVQISDLHPARTPAPNTPGDGSAPDGPPSKNPSKSRCAS